MVSDTDMIEGKRELDQEYRVITKQNERKPRGYVVCATPCENGLCRFARHAEEHGRRRCPDTQRIVIVVSELPPAKVEARPSPHPRPSPSPGGEGGVSEAQPTKAGTGVKTDHAPMIREKVRK